MTVTGAVLAVFFILLVGGVLLSRIGQCYKLAAPKYEGGTKLRIA